MLVAGGQANPGNLASAELYDPSAGTWSATASLNAARFLHTATCLPNGVVIAAGGYNSGYLASAELYDFSRSTEVQGNGAVDNQGNEVSFKFQASQGDAGKLGVFSFCDPAAGNCVSRAGIYHLSFTANTGDFSGSGHLEDGTMVRFNVSVNDNDSSGTADTISIRLDNGYSVSGELTRGNIRIH